MRWERLDTGTGDSCKEAHSQHDWAEKISDSAELFFLYKISSFFILRSGFENINRDRTAI